MNVHDAPHESVRVKEGSSTPASAPSDMSSAARQPNALSEALLAIVDASPDIICFKGLDFRYLVSNPAHASWLGVRHGASIGRTTAEVLADTRQNFQFSGPHSPQAIIAADEEVLKTKATVQMSGECESPSGTRLNLEAVKFPVFDSAGEVAGIGTIGRDVSMFFDREAQILSEREFFNLAVGSSQDGIWDLSVSEATAQLSARTTAILGLAPEQRTLDVNAFTALLHPEDVRIARDELTAHIASGETHFAARFRLADASPEERWISVRASSQRHDDGSLFRMAGSVRDVTKETQTERALRDSEQRFIDFTRAGSDWFWETDENHCFVYVSENAAKVSGINPQDYVGRPRFDLSDRDGDAKSWREHHAALEAHEPFRGFEYSRTLDSGQRRTFRINGVPHFSAEGEFIGYRGTGVDVSEEKLAEARLAAGESRLFDAIEHMEDAAALFDPDDRLLFANTTYSERWGRHFDQAIPVGTSFETLVRSNVGQGLHKVIKGDTEEWIRWRMDLHRNPAGAFDVGYADGVYQFIENRTVDGGYLLLVRDVTDRVLHERALKSSEARYRVLYDENPTMYFTLDRHGQIMSVNHHGAKQLGYAPGALDGGSIEAIHVAEDYNAIRERIETCFAAPQQTHHWEIRKLAHSGESIWVRESAKVVRYANGTTTLLTVCEDISETRRLSDQLNYQASHDPLTGLVNRREFERRVLRVLETRRTADSEHALCYLDLDQFKVINDTCGHMAGDELLKQLTAVMNHRVRRRDTLARLGGDEFGVLLEHCPPQRAEQLANELVEAIHGFRFVWNDKVFSVGASVGLVPLTNDFDTLSDAMAAADEACYAAKEYGGDRVQIFYPDDVTLARRRGETRWLGRLNAALEHGQLRLAYQLIEPADPAHQEGLHYEMLLRLQDESGELIKPGIFLPAAERYNLLTRVDRWVVENTLAWLSAAPNRLEELHLCSINLSGQSLGDERFTAQLITIISESQVPASKICFEVTETAAITNLAAATHFIKRLRERGTRFALDDFGSGLSSFAYLKNLPVDFLKIDGVFVRDIAGDPIDYAMVRSINEIGHVMGKSTIAEFVEDEATVRALRDIGVDYLQGYHIARPQLIPGIPGHAFATTVDPANGKP